MAIAFDPSRSDQPAGRTEDDPRGRFARTAGSSALGPNTITASQARAARRRESRRDQQAVANWLRELSSR